MKFEGQRYKIEASKKSLTEKFIDAIEPWSGDDTWKKDEQIEEEEKVEKLKNAGNKL